VKTSSGSFEVKDYIGTKLAVPESNFCARPADSRQRLPLSSARRQYSPRVN